MANAIFISEKWLKDNTPLPSNLDVKEIYPFYQVSQDKYIRDVLGDNLYERLVSGLIANNLNSDEVKLIELFRPSLGYYIVYEAIPFLANKIRNIGVVKTADDKQTNADRADVKELRQQAANNAEYYMTRVRNYLCHNSKLYPQYTEHNEDVNPNHNAGYNCDLYIDPDFIDQKFIKQYYRQ